MARKELHYLQILIWFTRQKVCIQGNFPQGQLSWGGGQSFIGQSSKGNGPRGIALEPHADDMETALY